MIRVRKTELKKNILILNGPNLNLLGVREPDLYGATSLVQIEKSITKIADSYNITCEFFQTNHEGSMIDKIHEIILQDKLVDLIIINPAAWTHTSVALRDAILAVKTPFIEVHLSNIHAREDFRHHSYFSDKALGVICGFGAYGYQAALQFAAEFFKKDS